MDDIHLFLAHAVRLEAEAARRFEELADAMHTFGNAEVEAFFRQMATYSREHLAEAQTRSGFRPLPALAPDEYSWPDGTSPETAAWAGVDGLMSVADALQLALQSEQAGREFYAVIAAGSRNPRVKSMANEFAAEEAEHVSALERLIERCAA
ncbi:MAG TPA: ferritin family protein [Aromatoleum sp.]|uniref:ferritin-like domain-containing protein n=1 Tax=Aromatoleum sp. TaxID=2307007 RepID=UPI002B460366|nr:ferritin family protein [Aromatoleum sp.]HJV26144.1 ferritin family protein [Aromatoleum sp.]